MLKAVIFDFDGVIVDTEPLHLSAFKEILRRYDMSVSDEDYYNIYLAMDDWTFFREIFSRNKKGLSKEKLETLVEEKGRAFEKLIGCKIEPKLGVLNLVERLSQSYILAIASMARKSEILMILKELGLSEYFKVVISAEDVSKSKPDPEVFLKALAEINKISKKKINPVMAGQCLVIEDSPAGIKAAKRAGMRCLGVVGSKSKDDLKSADLVVDGLDKVTLEEIEKIFFREDK